jgi:Second Messenger Oligonucleotide or Dinucleotide Synthetase domain
VSSPRLSPIGIPQLLTLAGLAASPAPNSTVLRWIAVRPRFEQFNRELALTARQETDAWTKWTGVVGSLNRHYYGTDSRTDNSFLVGSWAKRTAGRPPRDVDLYFVLPYEVYQRFQNHLWNRQSALLQEIKDVLSVTYPETDMTADGQIVLVRFDSYNVEGRAGVRAH